MSRKEKLIERSPAGVIPAKAGIQERPLFPKESRNYTLLRNESLSWIPAFARMTPFVLISVGYVFMNI